MRITFLADASLHHGIVLGLRNREPLVDILSAHEAGLEGIDDQKVLGIASQLGRVLLSSDRKTMPAEFGIFMAHNRTSPGVFLISQKVPVGMAIEELLLLWAASEDDEWRDCLCSLPLPAR